jgi:pimeloyl-ACP methyl ester carboxylesterase
MWARLALFCGMVSMAAHASAGTLPLHECRLEHPLRLSSLAARCGRLTVSENPAEPSGASINLSVAVIPALNRRAAAAPVFLLAGGPGQAASDLYTSFAAAFARINRNHDIVLVDQRGTGRSAPLTCSYPDDWRTDANELSALRAATLACLARFGDRARYYTTSVAVRDLEQVRVALGYGPIDLYGSSYGTRVAELYMRRYPQATHAVILDGVTYPEQVIGPETPADAPSHRRTLRAGARLRRRVPESGARSRRLAPPVWPGHTFS